MKSRMDGHLAWADRPCAQADYVVFKTRQQSVMFVGFVRFPEDIRSHFHIGRTEGGYHRYRARRSMGMRAMMSSSVSHASAVGNDSGEDWDGHARRHSDSSCVPSMRCTPVRAA